MIPTFFGISLIVFLISVNTPGDPIELLMDKQLQVKGNEATKRSVDQKINELGRKYNFDAPLFYIRVTDQTQSDTLHKILTKSYRENLSKLSFEHGDWELVNEYNRSIGKLTELGYQINDVATKSQLLQFLEKLKKTPTTKDLIDQLLFFKNNRIKDFSVKSEINHLENIILRMASTSDKLNRFIPQFIWFGSHNQYHYWVTNLLTGNLGDSYFDKTPVKTKVGNAIVWTLLFSILSIVVSYLIAVPLGIYLSQNKDSRFAKFINSLLFAIHCIPSFWIASLLIIFLASPEYIQLFPSYGLGEFNQNQSTFGKFFELIPHIILPLICFSYSSIAYISEQTRRSILQIESSDFILTARAKGLTKRMIYWKHMLSNTSFTLITQLGNLIPTLISGSFVVEYIFAIPGMGKLLVDSIGYRDYPTVFSIIMISAVLVMLGVLLSDFLYMRFDPRVSLINKKEL
tara:strand:- start:3813 stop:5189 length:1377 start_codon:yes stop_codon:yes gene_type:complete